MQNFTIHLPVKGYIKKYLAHRYGTPIHLRHNDVFSDVFVAMLLVPMPVKHRRSELDQQLQRHTEKISVKVPIDMFYRVPKELNEFSTYRLNRFFENLFREDFCEDVADMVLYRKVERKDAIYLVAEKKLLDVEEDITFDALKKMEYRYRMEKEEILKKTMADLSPDNLLFSKS